MASLNGLNLQFCIVTSFKIAFVFKLELTWKVGFSELGYEGEAIVKGMLQNQTPWVQIPAMPLPSCVTLGYFVPQLSHL